MRWFKNVYHKIVLIIKYLPVTEKMNVYKLNHIHILIYFMVFWNVGQICST